MAFPLLLTLLAGGGGAAYLDGRYNDGDGTRTVLSSVADAFGNIISPKSHDTAGDPNSPDSGGGLMDFISNNWDKTLGVAGLGALWMSNMPTFIKKLATVAAIVYMAYDFFKGQNKNEFNTAAENTNTRTNVLKAGFDPTDPNIVGQTRDRTAEGPAPVITNE